ncbi:MAG: DUF2200 family protein [Planctomycetota bacterium]
MTKTTTKEHDERIATMTFASVYPHYVTKVEKKGRTVKELHQVIEWLTGFKTKDLKRLMKSEATFEEYPRNRRRPQPSSTSASPTLNLGGRNHSSSALRAETSRLSEPCC